MKRTPILRLTTVLLALALPCSLLAAQAGKKAPAPAKPAPAAKGVKKPPAPAPPQDPVKQGMNAALSLYDKDSDNAITGDEIKSVRDAFAVDKTGPLKGLDANHDGTLDDAEIAAIHRIKAPVVPGAAKPKKKGPAAPAPAAPAAAPKP